MCGIAGVWDNNKISREVLDKMRVSLGHRGPDDSGVFIDENNNLGLCHQRLSIIDLSDSGRQPMTDENLTIVFNGEIYNFQEIRKELEIKSYKFKSRSDTEVILKSYRKWGKEAVQKFRGMFAFAVFDSQKQKLILCRDRAGVKPLYYYYDKGFFAFASEIKALILHPRVKKQINPGALRLFLRFGYIPEPHSIFNNLYKLEPGHFLELGRDKEIKKEKYWDVIDFYNKGPELFSKNKQTFEQASGEMEKILIDSFKLRLVADVPVGIFLSGGVDSSLVAALLSKNTSQPLKTFTVGFREREYDESRYAKKIANYLGTEHQEFVCSEQEVMEVIPKLAEIYDEPFGDSSAIPTYLLSRFVKNYVKVSLSADAGDEIFGGYSHYKTINFIYRLINKAPSSVLSGAADLFLKGRNSRNRINKIKTALKNKNDFQAAFEAISGYWLEQNILLDKAEILPTYFDDFSRVGSLDRITQMQAVDFKTYLASDILVKVDRATMANGLEGRDPLLDQNIIEYAASLPLNFKYPNKIILRKILSRYIPEGLYNRPKKGFEIPLDGWFKGKLAFLADQYLNPEKIKRDNILNYKIISQERDYFNKGKVSFGRLWLILVFQMWKEKWL